jgi:HPt (histidine-containing phosphotransfer) domain-containing protein
MPDAPPLSSPDPSPDAARLQRNLHALHDTLSRIGAQNNDLALQPLIAETVSLCRLVRRQVDQMTTPHAGPDAIVDAKVFQRLMALAGPTTALDLLHHLLADLGAATTAIAAAVQPLDKAVLRAQCHILIAVAGSIGAVSVQSDAEHLHKAAQNDDAPQMAVMSAHLLRRLAALLAYVQDELHARKLA